VPVILNLTDRRITALEADDRTLPPGSPTRWNGGMQRIARRCFLLTAAQRRVSAEEKAETDRQGLLNQS